MSVKSSENVYWGSVTTDLGTSHLAATEKGLCRHSLPGELPDNFFAWLDKNFEADRIAEDQARIEFAKEYISEYVAGSEIRKDIVLDIHGTEFQQRVWTEIRRVNFGEMVSYQMIAKKLDLNSGAQAVGTAVGQNPLHLFIPCHRIIGSKGDLRGFAAGTIMKKWLLTHEGALLI